MGPKKMQKLSLFEFQNGTYIYNSFFAWSGALVRSRASHNSYTNLY